jgi:predicted Zn-dependent protease
MSHHSHIPPEVDEAIRGFIRRNKRALRRLLPVLLVAVLAALGLGAWALWRGAAALGRWGLGEAAGLRVPIAWERPLGDAALAQLRGQMRFVTEARATEALKRLAAPLQASALLKGERITVFLVDTPAVNALALPGGYVVVYRGLVERAGSASEVQGVLAHEIAHVVKRHAVGQLASNLGLEVLLQQVLTGENRALDRLIGGSGQLLTLKFSRDQERAADDLAWELLVAAGIDPGGLGRFFAALAGPGVEKEPGAAPLAELLRTHPAPAERLERLRQKGEASAPLAGYRSYEADLSALKGAR